MAVLQILLHTLLGAVVATVIQRSWYFQEDIGVVSRELSYSVSWDGSSGNDRNDPAAGNNGGRLGKMIMAWQTPIYRVNFAEMFAQAGGLKNLNKKVCSLFLKHYYRLLSANKGRLKMSGAEEHGANQVFYEWQLQQGWEFFNREPEIKALMGIFQKATDTFLRVIGQDEEFISQRSRHVFAWATVHHHGVSHMPHTHPDQLVSGVYYVKIPTDAGAILFDDPRGPRPPFDQRITVHPQEGDLILFPSWLVHQVTSTPGTEERVSIAFNVPGKWESTAGVQVEFPVE